MDTMFIVGHHCLCHLLEQGTDVEQSLFVALMFWSLSSGKDVAIEKSGILVTMDTYLIAEYKDRHLYTQRMQEHPSEA